MWSGELLGLDLPIQRTRERNFYRSSLIGLEQATRSVQTLEDQIKTAIRNELRTLLHAQVHIPAHALEMLPRHERPHVGALDRAGRDLELRQLLPDGLDQPVARVADRHGH